MEENKVTNNLGEERKVNLSRPVNLMQDIKKPNTHVIPQEAPSNIESPKIKDYTPKKPSAKKFYVILSLALILVVVSACAAFYFYQKTKLEKTSENTPEGELDQAVLNISKIAVLPINDTPTLFSVSDPEQLRSDAFFDKSQAGDQMLLYPRIGFAVLYRPSTKQIVNMMIFDPELETSTSTATSTATTTTPR